MLECRKVPRLPRETRLRNAWNVQNRTFLHNSSRVAAIGPSRGRLRTVVNGYGRLRTQTQSRANTPSTPRPQSETGTFATHSGSSFHSFTNGWQGILCCATARNWGQSAIESAQHDQATMMQSMMANKDIWCLDNVHLSWNIPWHMWKIACEQVACPHTRTKQQYQRQTPTNWQHLDANVYTYYRMQNVCRV